MPKGQLTFVAALAVIGLASCGGGGSSSQVPPPSSKPAASLSVSALGFSGQVVGSTSPAESVALRNTGTATLAITSITTTGDFAASPAGCGTSLAASASCNIGVTFAPQSGGSQNGSLIVTDNAAGSPHTVVLTGTGMSGLVKLSTDTFTNTTSQHATEVEPDTLAFGSTIVSVFQVGRFFDGGASAIGFATSLDGGTTWTNGFLPGITKLQNPANSYDRVSDPTVAYDDLHKVWLAASLPIVGTTAPDVVVNRSLDGGITWGNPITVNSAPGNLDKSWIACDNWPASSHYGNCYVEWDANAGFTNDIRMSTSTDGGLTWSAPLPTANGATGLGGQPLAQPNGNVIVPIADASVANILAFRSTDGGGSWSSTVTISAVSEHPVGPAGPATGMMRTDALPSAEADANGTVYVVWQDCRFRTNCSSNDIVMSTSADGLTWSAPARIPIDPTTSTVDHFIPGIAVDPTTAGNTAHLALTYYYYPVANCTAATCQLFGGFVSSDDGGATWSAPTQLAGPMNVSALPQTSLGLMVGDYISTSFVNGLAFGAFAVANPAAGLVYDEAIYTTATGRSATRTVKRFSSALERPVPSAFSVRALSTEPKKIR